MMSPCRRVSKKAKREALHFVEKNFAHVCTMRWRLPPYPALDGLQERAADVGGEQGERCNWQGAGGKAHRTDRTIPLPISQGHAMPSAESKRMSPPRRGCGRRSPLKKDRFGRCAPQVVGPHRACAGPSATPARRARSSTRHAGDVVSEAARSDTGGLPAQCAMQMSRYTSHSRMSVSCRPTPTALPSSSTRIWSGRGPPRCAG